MSLHKEIKFENDICAHLAAYHGAGAEAVLLDRLHKAGRYGHLRRHGLRDILLGPARLYEALRGEGQLPGD